MSKTLMQTLRELPKEETPVPVKAERLIEESEGMDTPTAYRFLSSESEVLTPISEIKQIAKTYSKHYGLPIRISAAKVEEYGPTCDAIIVRKGKKVVVYLHPVLEYYPRSYVERVIGHEVAHLIIDQCWED